MKRHVVWCTVRMHWMMMPISSDERVGSKGALFGVAGGGELKCSCGICCWLCPERSLNFGSGAQDTINNRDIKFRSS